MAEINSTLEKVMERLAAMDSGASDVDLDRDEMVKEGMRSGAAFLRGEEVDLARVGEGLSPRESGARRQGVVQVLLRNILLPREDNMAQIQRAMQGLVETAGGAGDLVDVVHEMKMILEHYLTQKEDLLRQLETALYRQLQQSMGPQFAEAEKRGIKIDATQHPKFHEEWQRIKTGLDEQYGGALDQHKHLVLQRLL